MLPPGKPLSRFKVLDLSRVRAGPTCVRQLADWGADVIKIEAPPDGKEGLGGDRDNSDFQNLHRNKRSLTLNLKAEEGREIFYKLVADADVVVENYRPDVKNRLGADYETLAKINERIILVSISGFGQDGPYGNRAGFDQIAQGMGGLMSITGAPGEGPMRVGIPVADLCAGMFAAQGTMLALLEREVSGKGQWVRTSLLEAMVQMLDFQAARFLKEGEVPGQAGNDHPTNIPTGVFPTSDGHINIAVAGGVMFERCCDALGHPEWNDDPLFSTSAARSKNRVQMNKVISEVTRTNTSEHWIELLNDVGCPAGPINSMDQVFADPQVQHLEMSVDVDHPRLGTFGVVNQAIKMSRTPSEVRTATPDQGEHTDSVLRELGYDESTIKRFHENGVV
ncbi:CaiB/BaiF CoA transferase family protein [Candidatus Lucifugimonas marina]|uniref:CoA transferase n=1 Tax=Candidatus Lucifugimonas marina TaxID=3038979 RepID=A0AAJ6CUN4_9CHLR|nr:CoA transferase [SAR202 cluster bacterium JH702]MDG0868351.1 CoA transferase [SAR202 cluster bacterium JH639]WFG34987.1 CoA transferase [SAR202 cluster bacterium JH545]WFG38945.1 CoA transferase [SAR202 cluster bacterium JH1073]